MTLILRFRESLQKIYSRYSLQVTIALKFLLGLLVFHTINANLAFMERVDTPVVVIALAALSSFLPPMVMVLSAILLICAHLYALSMPVMAITLLVFIILYIFYFRFVPGKTWPVLLVPMAFFFEVPLIIPMIFGLLGSPLMIVPAITGTIVYYVLYYIKYTETIYAAEGIQEIIDTSILFITNITANREQWLIASVMGVGVLIIYALRTRSFDYSWKVAIATGVVWLYAGFHLGSPFFDMEIPLEHFVANLILAALVGIVLEFLFFRVDYSRTEYLQFDDNEYYYYVKAIPKRFSENWTMKQEVARRKEEREKEEERQKRRTGLKHRGDEEPRGREVQGMDLEPGREPKPGREPRTVREEDRPPGRRLSNMLPPPHLRQGGREGEPEVVHGETNVIDTGQVNSKIKELGMKGMNAVRKIHPSQVKKQVSMNNQKPRSGQELEKSQMMGKDQVPRISQPSANNQAPVKQQKGEKRPDADGFLEVEASREVFKDQKQSQHQGKKDFSTNKKKDRGGKRKGSS